MNNRTMSLREVLKRLCMALGLAVLPLWLAGCPALLSSLSTNSSYVFTNNSSYVIHVDPNGQGWSGFDLAVSQNHTVSIPESTIYFTYDQTTFVLCDTTVDGSITFTNGVHTELEVVGTPGNPASSAYIFYTADLGSVQVDQGALVPLPWTYSFAGSSGDYVDLAAITGTGDVTVTIYANNSVLLTASNSGGGDNASVYGNLP